MVLTQLQLKWPNHSTQLLSGLKSLFKNEHLVDCTLKCNKHTLKVHRSVLAACSPYFERELENNPLVVIQDMKFNVLQALIEFMYYGETRISEENLTSLIEAAKLFEIKGLSEMDLLTSGENNVPSVVAANKNCKVDTFADNMNDVFEHNLPTMNTLKSPIDEAISATVPSQCLSDGDDSNSNLMTESTAGQTHSNRNFVITPPQTESAQILLSLACSYSQKQFLNATPNDGAPMADTMSNGTDGRLLDHHPNLHAPLLFDEPPFILSETITSSSTEPHPMVIDPSPMSHPSLHPNMVTAESLTGITDFIDASTADRGKPNGVEPPADTESLLEKLLTRNQNSTRRNGNGSHGSARYASLYDAGPPGQTDSKTMARSTTFSHTPMPAAAQVDLPAGIILECPFLIETPAGYVDLAVENMFNALDADMFPQTSKNTVKIIPKEAVPLDDSTAVELPVEQPIDAVLERIQQDTVDELRDDPEAVVLTRVAEDGRLETLVLSSADVKALQQSNAERRKRRKAVAPVAMRDVESADASLITRIVQFGAPVDEAISKLPFRKSSRPPSAQSHCAEPLLATYPAQPHQSDHHHENMFEELDSQFMDSSIEHLQRDYCAYEEASKNETQLEHNYYANALKDEDEECVAISGAESYMMLLEQPLTNGNGAEKGKSAAYHRHIIGATDVYLNNVVAADKKERRNGLVASAGCVSSPTVEGEKAQFNGKPDLVTDEALAQMPKRVANGASKVPTKSRAASGQLNTLPFKSVKNASGEKKPRRTYKRKAAETRSQKRKKNGDLPFVDAALVEEIVVDEIS